MFTDVFIITSLFFTLASGLVISVLVLERTGW
ncbi:small membrane protein YoaI [Salmonella enterica]